MFPFISLALVTKKTCLLRIKRCIFIDVRKQKIYFVHCGCQKLTKDSSWLLHFWENKTVVKLINLLRLISQNMYCNKYEVNHFLEESVIKWAECLRWDYQKCFTFTECLEDPEYGQSSSLADMLVSSDTVSTISFY